MTDDRKVEHLVAIQARVAQLILLLDQILLLSKAQSVGLDFNPLPIQLEDFCREIIANLPHADQIHRIKLTLDDDLCTPVSADPKLLTLALNNLLGNALKYSPHWSPVGFMVSCDEATITFRIVDKGIGIPQEELGTLFELFQRASNVGDIPGTGLGLATVHEAVKAHHGTVSVESQIGEGATFTVTIPL